MFDIKLINKAQKLVIACEANQWKLGTVESCTGGLLAGLMTTLSGVSKIYPGSLVTYSNQLKHQLAHVPEKILKTHGAVSAQTVKAMCVGGQQTLQAELVIAITGIAGPDGGTQEKPVGLVYIGVAHLQKTRIQAYQFGDLGRDKVRLKTVEAALDQAFECMSAT